MGFSRTQGGTMALSASKQSVIGTGATVNRRLNNRNTKANNRYQNYNDRDEARTVYEGGGLQRILAAPYLPFDCPADDLSVPMLLAYALGSDTMTTPAGTPSSTAQHTIAANTVYTELPFATVQYNRLDLTTTALLKNTSYVGCSLKSLRLSGSQTGEVRAVGQWVGSGQTAAAISLSGLTAPSVGAFLGVNSFVGIGTGMAGAWTPGLPTGSAPTYSELAASPVDWAPYLLGWDFSIENTFAETIGHAGTLGFNANCMPLVDRVMKLTLNLRWDDSVLTLANLVDPQQPGNYDQTGGTAYPSLCLYNWSTLSLDTSGTIYKMSMSHIFPKVSIESSELVDQEGLIVAKVTYEIMKDATNNASYHYVWNKDRQAYAG